jgi:hypothetical protein
MEQCLQQAESAPMGQAFMLAARSKAVSTPSLWAFRSIWAVASQMVTSLGLISFKVSVFLASILFSLHEVIGVGGQLVLDGYFFIF